MKLYTKHPSQHQNFLINNGTTPIKVTPLKWLRVFTYLIVLPFRFLLRVLTLSSLLLPYKFRRKLNSTQRLFLNVIIASIFLVFGVWIYTSFSQPEQSEAAWFNDQWLYRQKVDITNSSGSNLTDFQVAITLNTAQMITDGKLQSDCDDIRFVNQKGDILHHWRIPTTLCNTSTTKFFVRITSIPTNGTTIFVYYGNSTAQNIEDAGKVFDRGGIRGFFYAHNSGSHPTTSAAFDTFFTSNIAGFQGQQLYSQINCANNNCNPFDPDDNSYATYFEGIIYIPTTGTYYFATDSDDASDIYIDGDFTASSSAGTNVANWYNGHGLANNWSQSGSIVLTKGYHTFRYRMEEISGGDGFRAAWQKPGDSSYSYITGEYFYSKKYASSEPTISLGTEEQSPGPVAYWKFDEGFGSQTVDTQNKIVGTLTNGTQWKNGSDCISGSCVFLDGENDYISMGDPASGILDFGTSDFTISAWIRIGTTSATYKPVIAAKGGWGTPGFRLEMMTNGLMYYRISDTVGGNETTLGTKVINDGKWHHVAWVFDRDGLVTGYIDGIAVGSNNISSYQTSISGTSNFYVGRNNGGNYFNGFIDELKVYRYARSAQEIKADMSSRGSVKGTSVGIGGSSPTSSLSNGLVGYWKMDETSWNGTAGEVIDSSGNGNNGTAVSGAEASPSAKFGRSGYFAGIDEYVNIGNINATNVLSVSAWFYTSSTINAASTGRELLGWSSWTGIILGSTTSNCTNEIITVFSNTGRSCWVSTTETISPGWHHVVVVWNSKNVQYDIYLDGNLKTPLTVGNTPEVTDGTNVIIGVLPSSNQYYNGNIDEVRIYNRALSPTEIQELYNFAPGPIAYYDFEEGQGTSLSDKSGNGNNSTSFGGTPTWTTGFYGSGMKFDNASTDQVTIPGSEILNYNNYTLGFWIKFTGEYDGTYRQIIARDPNGTDRSPGLWVIPNSLRVHWKHPYPGNAGPNAIGPGGENTSFVANKWYYMTGVKNGTSFDYYLNGVKIGSTYTLTDPMINDAGGSFYIGKSAGYNSAGFIIDEIKLYNYARTQKQIIEDMNAGHPAGGSPVGSQALYLKFDEGYGTTAYDSSPNRLNGTVSGGSTGSNTSATQVWTNDGKFGKAVEFDGIDDSISLSDNAALDIGTGDKTWTLWFKSGQTNRGILYRKSDASNANGVIIDINANATGRLRCYLHSTVISVESATGVAYNDDQWHHLACVLNRANNTWKLYIDGKLQNTADASSLSTTDLNAAGGVNISASPAYLGLIDDLKVYSSALTDNEVKIDLTRNSSLVLGAGSTSDDGTTASSSASRAYCIPGDTSTCNPPVGEWRFEEGSGGTVNDTSGNGNTGTWNGTGTLHWTKGKIGKAGNFEGNSDYVSVNSSATIPTGGTARTLEMWVYTTDNSWADNANTIFEYGTNTTRQAFGIDMNPFPNIEVYTWGDDATVNTGLSNKAGWWHLAVTYDGSTTIKTYINGVLKNTKTLAGVLNTASSTVNIGRSALVNAYFDGRLDHIQLYDYARSPAQIAWDYNRGKPVAHWKFDECQGSTVNDSSGNGNSGTLNIGGTGSQTSVGTCSTSGTAWGNGATGKFNHSLNFDGTDDYISTNYTHNFTNGFSATAWFRTTSSSSNLQTILANGGADSATVGIALRVNSAGKILFEGSKGTSGTWNFSTTSNKIVNDGIWHFITATWDGTTNTNAVKLYIDGILDQQTTALASVSNSSLTLSIGRIPGAGVSYFDGKIDDVQIFNYALTANQVKSLYNQGGAIRFGPTSGTP